MNRIGSLPGPARLSILGLGAASAGMLLQILSGSNLYPSLAGPIVLLVTAAVVLLGPSRWTRWPALFIPMALALGAIIAAGMSNGFIEQVTNLANAGLVAGSLMHLLGLGAAVVGAGLMVFPPRSAAVLNA